MKKFGVCIYIERGSFGFEKLKSEKWWKAVRICCNFDVMDGVFVNNISFGFPMLEAVKKMHRHMS